MLAARIDAGRASRGANAAIVRAVTQRDPRRDPAAELFALAHLDPAALLDYLISAHDDVRLSGIERSVASALALALDGAADVSPAVLEELAVCYGDVLSADAAARLFDLVPSGAPDVVGAALERCLLRFPNDARLLRTALKLAQARGDAQRVDALLTRLGIAENTPATVSLVQRLRADQPDPRRADVRIALLSSFTVDHLAPYVDLHTRTLGLAPALYVAPFNSWMTDILDEASALRRFAPDIAFLAVSIDDLVPELAQHHGDAALAEAGENALSRVLSAAEAFTRWAAPRPLVVHRFHSAFVRGPLGIFDGRGAPSRREWLDALNARLAAALRALPNCYLFDAEAAALAEGADLRDNPKMRHLAALRLPPAANGPIARAYVRYIAALKGLTKKCIVLDLDNTLWGGVVGEDGADGIRLGPASPGSEFVEFQHFLQSLARRGILLAVNSKNNPDDALEVIRRHEHMVLKEDAFSAVRINWKPKHENMQSIAAELNIGLDSMVFIDDNPDERAAMRHMLPGVLTVELPKDPAQYRATLESLQHLDVLTLTAEDLERTTRYRTERKRVAERETAQSLDAYLHSLGLRVAIAPAAKSDFARVAQLFARTNQFNTTTQRHTLSDVERFAGASEWSLFTLRSEDRFGDHGLVAVALVRHGASTWEIDSFLMSCRVIGYGIETAMLAHVAAAAAAEGAEVLAGRFVPTKKNAPARDLFERHGFVRRAGSDGERWSLDVACGIAAPLWIEKAGREA